MADQTMDEKMIVNYLLGALPEKETEQLDEMSLTNDDFAERLRDVENDLVDAYVRGELSADRVDRFKSYYLNSSRRRNKVNFAQTFRDMLSSQSKQIEKGDKFRHNQVKVDTALPAGLFAGKFRIPAYANAMLVLVVVLLIYPTYRSFILEREVTKLRHDLANPPKQTPAPVAPQLNPTVTQSSEPVVSPSLVFPVRTERAEQQKTIQINFDENRTVAVLFSLPSDNFDRYVLEMNRQNRSIWRQEIQAVPGETAQLVSITLHSGFFQEGEYELKISGQQGAEMIQLALYKLMISEQNQN